MAGNRSAAGNPPAHSPAHRRPVGRSADRPGESENHSRGAMQHRGGVGRLAGEKFAGAPSPQKKPV